MFYKVDPHRSCMVGWTSLGCTTHTKKRVRQYKKRYQIDSDNDAIARMLDADEQETNGQPQA